MKRFFNIRKKINIDFLNYIEHLLNNSFFIIQHGAKYARRRLSILTSMHQKSIPLNYLQT
jgi:hypothetical protein